MRWRDIIAMPDGCVGVLKDGKFGGPVNDMDTTGLYEGALTRLLDMNANTGAFTWKGVTLRASCATPLSRMRQERSPVFLRWPTKELPDPNELGYPEKFIRQFCSIRSGLVLLCGDQGSGKTTGAASLIRERARRNGEHVATFESPVEYHIDGPQGKGYVFQTTLNNEREYAFAADISLRMASPAAVFYGEIRAEHGVQQICSNAMSSHVVITTLHASDVVSGVMRFFNFLLGGKAEYKEYYAKMFSDVFSLCVHQKLVERNGKRMLELDWLERTDQVVSSIYHGGFHELTDVLHQQRTRRQMGLEA